MSFMEWKDSMSVGHPMIDRDHRMLMQYLNEMHEAMTAGKGKSVVGTILNRLVVYTRDHFGREELVWKAGHYVGYDKHKKEHTDLLKTVTDFKAKYDVGGLTLSVDVLNFLRDWLKNHILKSDKEAADAIATKGAKATPSPLHARGGALPVHK